MNVKEFANLLIKNELATSEELQGCSEKEIEQLEEHIGAKLPQTYREFLTLMGHDAGIFWRGTDYLYKSVFDLTEYARETMMDGSFKLPNDAFVFSSHQGYFFAYFRLSDGDDPPIYSYMEEEPYPTKWTESFSECLKETLDEQIFSLNQLKSRERYIREARFKKDN
jgi:hypothetical protein